MWRELRNLYLLSKHGNSFARDTREKYVIKEAETIEEKKFMEYILSSNKW